MNKKGVTLLEILVATVILGMVMSGLTAIFIASKRWTMHSRWRVTAGEVSRDFLEPLLREVRAQESSAGANDGWDQANNLLRGGSYSTSKTAGSKAYTGTYTNSNIVIGSGSVRKVKLNLGWQEVQ